MVPIMHSKNYRWEGYLALNWQLFNTESYVEKISQFPTVECEPAKGNVITHWLCFTSVLLKNWFRFFYATFIYLLWSFRKIYIYIYLKMYTVLRFWPCFTFFSLSNKYFSLSFTDKRARQTHRIIRLKSYLCPCRDLDDVWLLAV